jgi:hypothetical protein
MTERPQIIFYTLFILQTAHRVWVTWHCLQCNVSGFITMHFTCGGNRYLLVTFSPTLKKMEAQHFPERLVSHSKSHHSKNVESLKRLMCCCYFMTMPDMPRVHFHIYKNLQLHVMESGMVIFNDRTNKCSFLLFHVIMAVMK